MTFGGFLLAAAWVERSDGYAMPPPARLLSRHCLTDTRGIEALEMTGGTLYRICSEGGGICLYTPDLMRANIYADAMRPERYLRKS